MTQPRARDLADEITPYASALPGQSPARRLSPVPLARAHRSSQRARLPRAPWLPFAWLVLMFCSDLKVTRRSLSAAAAGIASIDNLIELTLFALIGIASTVTILRLRRRRRWSIGVKLFLAFGIFALLSTAWSPIPLFTAVRASQVIVIGLLALLSRELWLRGARDISADCHLILVMFGTAVFLLCLSGLLWPPPDSSEFAWRGMHRLTVGGYLAAAALVAFCQTSMATHRGKHYWWATACLATSLVLLLLNVTRSALAAAIAGIFIVYSTANRSRSLGRPAFAIGTTTFVAILMAGELEALGTYFLRNQPFSEFASLTGRTELWDFIARLIDLRPILGHGYGSSRVLLIGTFGWAGNAHNLIAETALGLGIVGGLIISWWLIWLLWSSLSLRHRSSGILTGISLGLAFQLLLTGVADDVVRPGLWLCVGALVTAVVCGLKDTEHQVRHLARSRRPYLKHAGA